MCESFVYSLFTYHYFFFFYGFLWVSFVFVYLISVILGATLFTFLIPLIWLNHTSLIFIESSKHCNNTNIRYFGGFEQNGHRFHINKKRSGNESWSFNITSGLIWKKKHFSSYFRKFPHHTPFFSIYVWNSFLSFVVCS